MHQYSASYPSPDLCNCIVCLPGLPQSHTARSWTVLSHMPSCRYFRWTAAFERGGVLHACLFWGYLICWYTFVGIVTAFSCLAFIWQVYCCLLLYVSTTILYTSCNLWIFHVNCSFSCKELSTMCCNVYLSLIHAAPNCPPDKPFVSCFVDPCKFATCPAHPVAVCKADYCGGCNARFFIGNMEVTDTCSKKNIMCQIISLLISRILHQVSSIVWLNLCTHNLKTLIYCINSLFAECPVTGQIFKDCGSACPANCTTPNPICTRQCVARCECPAGQVIDEKKNECVPRDQCPGMHVIAYCLAPNNYSSLSTLNWWLLANQLCSVYLRYCSIIIGDHFYVLYHAARLKCPLFHINLLNHTYTANICVKDGVTYQVGDTFPDECNTWYVYARHS